MQSKIEIKAELHTFTRTVISISNYPSLNRLSPLTLSASEASYRQVKKPDLFFHISHFTFHFSLLSARLEVTSKNTVAKLRCAASNYSLKFVA